jgi:drug/metabolite transporter (DMT)-like permease
MSTDRGVSAYAALAIGVVAIAWSAIFVRWTHMPGLASAFYRVFFAAILLWPCLLFTGVRLRSLDNATLRLAALGGLFFAGDVGLYNIAVLHTTAGGATILGNNAPVFVGLLSWIITRKAPPRYFWIVLAIATSGAALIMRVDAKHVGLEFTADLLAVGTSVCFALYLVVTQRLRDRCDAGTLLALSSTASAAALLLVALFTHTTLKIPMASSWSAVIGLAVVCQIVGYFSLTYALGHLPATVTSVILLAVGPLAALLALIVFGERMTPSQVLGGLLVLLGVWLAGRLHGVVALPAIVE